MPAGPAGQVLNPGRVMPSPRRPRTSWLDLVSIAASSACLVHCLGLPLLFAAVPAASSLLALPEWLHAVALATAIPASAIAMTGGYRHHGLAHPAQLGGIGMILLTGGVLAGERWLLETGLSVAGSLVLAMAHVMNWRLRRAPQAGCR